MGMKFTNFATSTLASGILAGATSLSVFAGDGAKFPVLGAGDYFYAVLENLVGAREIIKVTARTGDSFGTIVRAQDSTSALAWSAGDKVELRVVNANMADFPKLDEVNTFSQTQTFGAAPITSSLTGYLKGNGASAITAQAVPIPVTDGGTGATSLTLNNVLLGNNTSALQVVAPGTSGNVLTSTGTTWTSSSPSSLSIPTRQTVLGGPVDTSGLPAPGGTTGATTVTTTAISASVPFVVAFANGFGANGAVNLVGESTANLSWAGLSTNGTMYLYVDYNAGGLTTGSTTLAPTYQNGGTYSTTSGQATFNITEMVMKVGNGSTAVQTNRVFVGEVTVAGNVVTVITWYAYQGKYDSGYTNTLPATGLTTASHNIGVVPSWQGIIATAKNLTAEQGYSIGDVISLNSVSTYAISPPIVLTNLTIGLVAGNGTPPFVYLHKTTGSLVSLTSANWAYRFTVNRGW